MKVTQIIELSKSRSKVYIDDEFAFVLYKGELRMYHVREREELSKEDYRTIVEEVLPKRAKLRAMNLLTKKQYTTAGLRKKLQEGFYPGEIIDKALEYVASFHYIDDMRFAVDYITYHESSKSKRRIQMDLVAKGISEETIKNAWAIWENEGGKQDEIAMIQKLLEKKHFSAEDADYKERQKIYGYLLRKGFQNDDIRKAIRLEEE